MKYGHRLANDDSQANLSSMCTEEPPHIIQQNFQHIAEGVGTDNNIPPTSSAGRVIPLFAAEQDFSIRSSENFGSSEAAPNLTRMHMSGLLGPQGLMRGESDLSVATPAYSSSTANNGDSSGHTPCTSTSNSSNAVPDGATDHTNTHSASPDKHDSNRLPFFSATLNYGTPGFESMNTTGYDMPATTPGGSKDYNNPVNWETSTGLTPVAEGLFSQLMGMETGLGGWEL